MTYNLGLFLKSFYKSFFRTRGTHARLTKKRISFLLLFYSVWPIWGIVLWLTFFLDHIFFPGFIKQKLDKPLFILGNFRSGSTFLQRLIARDSWQFTSATTWDIFISPSVSLTKLFACLRRVDGWAGSPLTRLLKGFDQRTLGRVKIHPISFFQPEEDENFLLHLWSSFFAGMLFPFMEDYEDYFYFDQRIPERNRRGVMRFYQHIVQRHLYARKPVPHYLSKNPSFTPKISSIQKQFPDARIIYLVRDPLSMVLSTISWLGFTWRVFSDPLEKYPFKEEIVRFTRHWYDYPLEVLEKADPAKYMIIKHDHLVADPMKSVQQIYDKFGYVMNPEFEKILTEETEKSRRFNSAHHYSLDEIGLDRNRILEEFKDIYEKFGFTLPD